LLNDTHLDPFQKDLCHTLKTSAETLLFLVNDILDFSKIEAGQMQIEELPIQSNQFLDSIHSLLANQALEKGLELNMENRVFGKAFIGDPIRLRQIALNFASNAIKFTSQGSITLRLEVRQRSLRLEVQDTGIGLSKEQQQKLFSDYSQADTSTSRHFGGTGLGLAICKKLALLMEGSVGVQSEPNQGSVFWLEIPWRPTHIQETTPTTQTQASLNPNFQILIVDDNPINLKVARLLIQKMGATSTTVSSGSEALQLQKQQLFDVVLMDMIMPDLSGIETTELWRAHEQQTGQTQIPIFALTANVTPQDHENCKNAGMNGLLTKPIQAEHLRQTLLNVQERLFP
jgi:two-component system, sensor histidine kinase